jgi:hypothetical protein
MLFVFEVYRFNLACKAVSFVYYSGHAREYLVGINTIESKDIQ